MRYSVLATPIISSALAFITVENPILKKWTRTNWLDRRRHEMSIYLHAFMWFLNLIKEAQDRNK